MKFKLGVHVIRAWAASQVAEAQSELRWCLHDVSTRQ